MTSLLDRFEGTSGWLGLLVEHQVARRHRAMNAWLISLLRLEPQDRVLEINFGPGLAIRDIASRVSQGFVAGITVSEPLLRHAQRRNRAAIRAGHMELKMATARTVPYPESAFDKAFSIDSVTSWLDPVFDLTEIKRVVKPGGLLAVAWDRADFRADGNIDIAHAGDAVSNLLHEAGWTQVQQMTSEDASCVLGVKP